MAPFSQELESSQNPGRFNTLVFDEGERGPDNALRYQFETIARMPEQEQRLVRGVLDALTLSNNGSAYIDHHTRSFARELGLEQLTTPVRSPRNIVAQMRHL